jgi:hypothetical protein
MTRTFDYTALDYSSDRRVATLDDGTVLIRAGVPYADQDRVAVCFGNYWTVRGGTSTDFDVLDEGDRYRTRLQQFSSAEEAIFHVIGAPTDLFADGDVFRLHLLANEDGGPVHTDTGVPYDLIVEFPWTDSRARQAWCASEEAADLPNRFYGDSPEAAADAYFGITR